MNIALSNNINSFWVDNKEYYSFQSIEKFIKYFFPSNLDINIINNDNVYNSKIYDIQYTDNTILENTKINILICVENCNAHKHYRHYNKYGNYGDEKVKIYFYNHIDKLVVNEKFIAIPIIYTQINYFNSYYNEIKPTIFIPFEKKKFCIFVSNNPIRNDVKNNINKILSTMGKCDNLEMYKPILKNKSCYHSIEFINILQEYKFVFVCENSIADGYITEKIFNCFFSRSIPIYNGSQQIEKYFNKNIFINANNINNLKKRHFLNNNEKLFNTLIDTNKINDEFNDEDYKIKLKTFIDNNIID